MFAEGTNLGIVGGSANPDGAKSGFLGGVRVSVSLGRWFVAEAELAGLATEDRLHQRKARVLGYRLSSEVVPAVAVAEPPSPALGPAEVDQATQAQGELEALAAAPRTLGDLLDRGREIRFEPGTVKLLETSLPFLDELAAALVKDPTARLEIVAHTADTGDAKKDLTLSKRRADVIKRVLVDKGANAEQLLATGRGSEDPVAPNLTRTGRYRNERVELHRASSPARGS